jgi:hypothetical protein
MDRYALKKPSPIPWKYPLPFTGPFAAWSRNQIIVMVKDCALGRDVGNSHIMIFLEDDQKDGDPPKYAGFVIDCHHHFPWGDMVANSDEISLPGLLERIMTELPESRNEIKALKDLLEKYKLYTVHKT